MAKKTKIDVNLWKNRIRAAEKARKDLLTEIDENVANYNGSVIGFGETGFYKKQSVEVNLTYVDLKQSVSALYSKNPYIYFEATKPDSEKSAAIFESAINTLWGKLKMKSVMRDAVKAVKLNGIACFKTFFNFKKDFQKNDWSGRVFNDEVLTERISIDRVLKDPDATSFQTSPWIAHESIEPIHDIAERFKITDDDIGKIKVKKTTNGISENMGAIDDEFKFGCFYEIEDRKNKRLFVIIDGFDKVFDEKELDIPFDTMWDFLVYNDIPDCSEIHSDYHFWRPQLREVSIYRTMAANHAKKGNAKYKAFGKRLSEDQISQLKTSEDSSVVQLDTDQNVEPFQHSTVDRSIFEAELSARSDIGLISKQAPRQSIGKKTATEIEAVEAAAQEVEGENVERLEEVIESICYKWALLILKNYDYKRMIRLTEMTDAKFLMLRNKINTDGNNLLTGSSRKPFLEFSQEDLSEFVSVKIQPGSTLPDNAQSRIQKFMGFAKFMASVPGAVAAVDLEEVILEAEEVFGVRNMNLLKKKDSPEEESKLLNAGVLVVAKLSEDHGYHIRVHESESNDNYQNALHIQMHKELKAQIEKSQEQQSLSRPSQIGAVDLIQPTGRSFINAPTGQAPQVIGLAPNQQQSAVGQGGF